MSVGEPPTENTEKDGWERSRRGMGIATTISMAMATRRST